MALFFENIDYNTQQNYEYATRESMKQHLEQDTECLQTDYNDFNYTLIRKGVFEQIKFPWFNADNTISNMNGELFFFKRCIEMNIDTFVHLKVVIGLENNIVI